MAVYDLSITDGLLSTTRAVRKRLDFERPVSNDIIRACLELALQAPTGANRQGWRWIVITDRDKRNAMGEIYRRGAGTYLEDGQRNADTTGAAQDSRVFSSAQYLAANIQKAPVQRHPLHCSGSTTRRPSTSRVAGAYGIDLAGGMELSARATSPWSRLNFYHPPSAPW